MVPPDMTYGEIIEALLDIARVLSTHVNKGMSPRVNVVESTMTSTLRLYEDNYSYLY